MMFKFLYKTRNSKKKEYLQLHFNSHGNEWKIFVKNIDVYYETIEVKNMLINWFLRHVKLE